MFLDVVLIIAGVALVLWGADRLTDGAASLARRMNIPEIIIGLTIVAAGTSAPELFVSMVSALKGTPDMAVGNVVGSNVMNALLIVGCAAIAKPMAITRASVRKDIPFVVLATLLLIVCAMDGWQSATLTGNVISRRDGAVLLFGFAAFMYYTLSQARQAPGEQQEASKKTNAWLSVAFVLIGLACLVVGSDIFVDAASRVASLLGVSDSVIGLTIVAGGTSLPELATSVVAARKGQSAIAIGNVIGSNVFNILMILGLTAVVTPLQLHGITLVDMGMMALSVGLVWLFARTRYTVERWEGFLLIVVYLVYLAWLLANA